MTSGANSLSIVLPGEQVEELLKEGRDLAKADQLEQSIALLEQALVLELSNFYYLYGALKAQIQQKSIYQTK